MANIAAKLDRYFRELLFCLHAGADFRSRAGLARDTLRFHFANGLGMDQRGMNAEPKCRRITLKDSVADLWLRTYGGDLFVFHEVLLDRIYQIPNSWAGDVATVVDLGANIGITTLFFSQYFPNARYVCVEPDSENARLLRRNVAGLGDRVQIIEGAVSDHSGSRAFDRSGRSWEGRLCGQGISGPQVRCYTMNEVMAESTLTSIDILKVDIEGAEEQLFMSGGDWLKRVKLMIVELHDAYTIERFRKDVAAMGFTVIAPGPKYQNRMTLALNQSNLCLNS